MDDDQQFCLRWNNHQSTLISVFDTLLENETLVDCTLAAEGKFLKAHKVVLSACSPYFAALLQEQYDKHPIFILKDVKYQELRAMMDYMYRGEVNISQDQLAALLKAAESLQIKGLSDNRTGSSSAPKPEHHRGGLNVPAGMGSGASKLGSGYTLEQTKRARIGPSSMDSQDMSGSREGSSSPSRRRRKVRRRSIENAMADVHDNSNSSQIQSNQASSLLQQQQQSNASLAGVGAITAAASALASQIPVSAATLPSGSSISASTITGAGAAISTQGTTQQQLTTSVTKKTESVKGTSDAMNTENVQSAAVSGAVVDDQDMDQHVVKGEKQNHKQKSIGSSASVTGKDTTTELVIEPKSEYDDEGNEETVEDLTLDDEDMGMDDLDQNAGTSQGGEGSSQGYAAWQHDRSQDELLLATQEAQQRDPQDLSRKIAQLHKENTAPLPKIQKTNQRSILNTHIRKSAQGRSSLQSDVKQQHSNDTTASELRGMRKRLSMSDVSEKLFEFYKTNKAKAPKNQQELLQQNKIGQTSPTSAETLEPSTIAAIATNGAAVVKTTETVMDKETASKNLQSDEMVSAQCSGANNTANNASFHPRIKYTNKHTTDAAATEGEQTSEELRGRITAIPTSVLVSNLSQMDVKPIIHPGTGMVISPAAAVVAAATAASSVIKPVPAVANAVPSQAAAIAAALFRDGYHSFQQQLRAQEILKQTSSGAVKKTSSNGEITPTPTATGIFENFLRQQRSNSECENQLPTISTAAGANYSDADDDDMDDDGDAEDSRFNDFDDIHLVEGKTNYGNNSLTSIFQGAAATSNASATPPTMAAADYLTEESQKYILTQAQEQALRNLQYSLVDYGSSSNISAAGTISPNGNNATDIEAVYECRHCGKKYRWKSTLRRHENVECGGKEPSHQCPYCPYKSKQRGNLGVHVRKHHSNLPQLASKRRSKYSVKLESGTSSANVSDDSSSKLIIDCSK